MAASSVLLRCVPAVERHSSTRRGQRPCPASPCRNRRSIRHRPFLAFWSNLPPMRIQFCGADRTVTGSCHLLEINGLRIFLDGGLYQGHRDIARDLNQRLPDNAASADAIILSHGHLDHCGKLPVFVKAGYRGPIYVTPASAEVARIVLNDSAKIQLEDAAY